MSQYPTGLQWVVRCTPLYQGVALERGLILGDVSWALAGHVVYLVVLAAWGWWLTVRRLHRRLIET